MPPELLPASRQAGQASSWTGALLPGNPSLARDKSGAQEELCENRFHSRPFHEKRGHAAALFTIGALPFGLLFVVPYFWFSIFLPSETFR